MIKEYDHLYKTVLIGNSGVGKSSILIRFAENEFKDHYLATIGVDFRFKTKEVDGKDVKFQIWDTAGQERFRTITSAYYKGGQAILLVFDLTDIQSFHDICKFWMGEVEQFADKDTILVLVGNKSDLIDSRRVDENEIKAYCELKRMKYVECSAKDNYQVGNVFTDIARMLMKKEQSANSQGKKAKGTVLKSKNSSPNKKTCC